MLAEEGKKVTVSFVCRLEDGTLYDLADRDTLEFVVGQGNTLPSLEMGVLGMKPGEHRVIRVPAAEVSEFPFDQQEPATEPRFPAGTGRRIGYEFGPGDDGDVILTPPPQPRQPREAPPAGADLFFDIEMIKVEEAELELGE